MVIVIFLLLLKIVKKFLKALLLTLLIVFLILFVAGYVIYTDASRFAKLMQGNKSALLEIDGRMVAGIRLDSSTNLLQQDTVLNYYTRELLSVANETIPDNELTFIVRPGSFSGDESISINDVSIIITSERMSSIMNSSSMNEIILLLTGESNLSSSEKSDLADKARKMYPSEQPLKNFIFGSALLENIKKYGLYYILNNTRAGNIEVRPGFISLKIAGYLPESVVHSVLGNSSG